MTFLNDIPDRLSQESLIQTSYLFPNKYRSKHIQ